MEPRDGRLGDLGHFLFFAGVVGNFINALNRNQGAVHVHGQQFELICCVLGPKHCNVASVLFGHVQKRTAVGLESVGQCVA